MIKSCHYLQKYTLKNKSHLLIKTSPGKSDLSHAFLIKVFYSLKLNVHIFITWVESYRKSINIKDKWNPVSSNVNVSYTHQALGHSLPLLKRKLIGSKNWNKNTLCSIVWQSFLNLKFFKAIYIVPTAPVNSSY